MTRIAVIGPGRAGTAVAWAAADAGYDLDVVAGGSPASRQRFASYVPSATATDVDDAPRQADMLIIAVPDAAVRDIARHLAAVDTVRPGIRVIHLAGCLGLEPLESLRLAGARVAACHPAQTLPDPERGREALSGCAWAVTAPDPDRGWARRFVLDLDGRPFDIADGDRGTYHAAMTLGGNAVSTVVTLARDLLLGIRVAEPQAFLAPLATAAVTGAAEDGPAALTGPVRRGDAETVATHLRELGVVMPEAVDAYLALAEFTVAQARRAGLDREGADAVRQVLDQARRAWAGPPPG